MTNFTQTLWQSIASDIIPAILQHPFLQGLADGTLSEAAFRHYVLQDSAYLESYGRGLALLAAKADANATFMMFCEHARNTLIVEEALHRDFMSAWPDHQPPAWHAMSPHGLLYCSYLIRVAYERPFHEALAAYLPCYWIYLKVGQHLSGAASPNPLYQKWIDTYAGDAFAHVVNEILNVVDQLADQLSDSQRQQMLIQFRRTSHMEYLFWDSAYHDRNWMDPEPLLDAKTAEK